VGGSFLVKEYFNNIIGGIQSFWKGLSLTFKHMKNKKDLVATLQYPNEKWPIPERNIGFDLSEYNVIRSRLHVDMDDCIGCLQCERACPVDCIKIDTIKPPKESEFDCGKTSFGTQKKLVVPRFTIDMSECMYCNLCVYPCPEECIYMVGGPNEDKHEIDYEFSQYTRDGLIFEFADATDEDILTVGGDEYIKTREEKKKRMTEGESLDGKEILPEKEEKINRAAASTPAPSSDKPDFTIINEIEDRVTRATAKKAFTQKFKERASFQEISEFVKLSLVENEKYSSDLDDIIKRVSEMKAAEAVDTGSPGAAPVNEGMTHKSFNDLENKMQRGIVKKIFIGEKKKGLSDLDILKVIRADLKTKEMLDDQTKELLKKLMLQSVKPKETPKAESGVFDLKKLNDIEDKMTRGLAKKIYTKSKRDGKKSTEILADIENELQSSEKLTDTVAAIITGIRESI
jgi:NADH-quinone oxidoreductase subunit I